MLQRVTPKLETVTEDEAPGLDTRHGRPERLRTTIFDRCKSSGKYSLDQSMCCYARDNRPEPAPMWVVKGGGEWQLNFSCHMQNMHVSSPLLDLLCYAHLGVMLQPPVIRFSL